jgi:hypothetical protein
MYEGPDQPNGQANEVDGESGESAIGRFAEYLAGTIISPSETLRRIGEREAILPAFVVVMLMAGISAATQLVLLAFNLDPFGAIEAEFPGLASQSFMAMQFTGIVSNFIMVPVIWLIVSGLLFGAAWLLGGRGRFMTLWAATGFALVPQLVTAPVTAAGELLGLVGSGAQVLGWLITLPVSIGAFIWTLVLFAIAVRETMNVTTGRAAGSIGLLIGGCLLLLILLACLIFIVIFGIIAAVSA